MKQFRQRLLEGECLVGTIVTLDSPEVVEVLCHAGFDWLFIDAEHAPLGPASLQRLFQAAGSVPCLVRVPDIDETWIKKALDAGAAGIIAPQVNSAQQARQLVQCCRYPPHGSRGVGMARAQGYGFNFDPYVQSANERITVVAQVENIAAVENIESICSVEGLDAVFIGPYDLSASLGMLRKPDDPAVQDAIGRVTSACIAAGVKLGIAGFKSQTLESYVAQGYSVLIAGVDTLFIGNSARDLLHTVRTIGQATA